MADAGMERRCEREEREGKRQSADIGVERWKC